jgi:uncharacterized protein
VMSPRGPLWTLGAPVRWVLLGAIVVYRVTLSGWLGGQCRFSPTCSRYAEEAIRVHGAIRGSYLAARRILRCHPFHAGGIDPVPRRPYDGDIQPTRVEGRHAG